MHRSTGQAWGRMRATAIVLEVDRQLEVSRSEQRAEAERSESPMATFAKMRRLELCMKAIHCVPNRYSSCNSDREGSNHERLRADQQK